MWSKQKLMLKLVEVQGEIVLRLVDRHLKLEERITRLETLLQAEGIDTHTSLM